LLDFFKVLHLLRELLHILLKKIIKKGLRFCCTYAVASAQAFRHLLL